MTDIIKCNGNYVLMDWLVIIWLSLCSLGFAIIVWFNTKGIGMNSLSEPFDVVE